MPKSFRQSEVPPSERNCTIKGCVWTYREYGIKKNGGKNWYVWYYDAVEGDRVRHSLFTEVLRDAKQRVIDMANGFDPQYLGGDPDLFDIVKAFIDTFPKERPPIAPNSDGSPLAAWQKSRRTRVDHNHRVWKMMEPTFSALLKTKKVSKLTPQLQEDVLKHLHERNYSVSSISLMMSLFSRALTWAATPDRNGVIKSRFRPSIIRKHKLIAKTVGAPRPKPDNYAPRRDELVQVILAIAHHEPVRRWLLVMLTFGCRVEAAAEATSEQLVGSIFFLNPKGRPEEDNKVRPELPVAWSSLTEMQSWEAGEWVGMSANSIGYVIRKVRAQVGLPQLKPSSIRDYISTMLRHAHVHYGARKVDKEERMKWQGHAYEPDKTNDNYGEVLPEFYLRAKMATEAMLRDLDYRSGGALFRQGADKTPISEYASLEDFEISGLLGVNKNPELPRDTTLYLGPGRDKTGENGPIQGSFRQVSDNLVRHPDGTIDALGSFGRPPLERRLALEGFVVLEPASDEINNTSNNSYIIATSLNHIPAARAGDLKKSAKYQTVLSKTLNLYEIDPDTGPEYIAELRQFEIDMTKELEACKNESDYFIFDHHFNRELPFVIQPIVFGSKARREPLDFSGMTDLEIWKYVESRESAA